MNKSKISLAESGHILLYSALAIVIVAVGGLAAWRIHEQDKTQSAKAITSNTTAALPPVSQAVTTPLPAGTDNISLQSDLSNVNSSFSQQTSDQTVVNGAVNDQQNEITVPTN